MAFVRYTHNGAPTIGIFEDGLVCPTSAATLAEALVEGASAVGPGQMLDRVSLLPCVDPTAKILCVALNYVDHAKEANVDVPESPIFFFKSREAMIAAGDPIEMPKAVTEIDWEGELAIIIGKDAFEISKEDAWNHIAGIAPFNDGSPMRCSRRCASGRTDRWMRSSERWRCLRQARSPAHDPSGSFRSFPTGIRSMRRGHAPVTGRAPDLKPPYRSDRRCPRRARRRLPRRDVRASSRHTGLHIRW